MKKYLLYLGVLAILIIFAAALHRSGPAIPAKEVPAASESGTTQPNQPNQAPELPLNVSACFRPYQDDSVWNVPIDWSKAKIHPDNDQMMAAFFHLEDWIGSDPTQFAPNIYFVSNETPLVEVKLIKNRYRDAINDLSIQYGTPGGTVLMPIPEGAVPAPGTDAQMAIINVETGEEWGINKAVVGSDGQWSVGGAYRYNIKNSGIPPEGFGQRGGGIGQIAGIVRPCEVKRGSINHAVTLAYDYPCDEATCAQNGWPFAIPPFTKTDGRGESPYDIPEGARIAIRPEITAEEIHSVCNDIRGCEVWVKNMQEYGGFLVDNSNHPKTYAEGNATAKWDPAVWADEMLRNVPPDWYVVIDWNFPSTRVP